MGSIETDTRLLPAGNRMLSVAEIPRPNTFMEKVVFPRLSVLTRMLEACPSRSDAADTVGASSHERRDLHGGHVAGKRHEIRVGGDEDHPPAPEGQPIGFQREIEPVETPQGFQVRERIRNGLFALRPLAVGRPSLFGLCAGTPRLRPCGIYDPRQQAERQKNR